MANSTTYKDSGVDIDLGDECSKVMYNASQETWQNRKGRIGEVISSFNDFSGLRFINMSNLPDVGMNMNFDGVGTKMELAERLSTHTGDFTCHQGIAFDLLAMVCDDAVIRGAEPISVGSILDVNKLNLELVKNLAKGMIDAAKDARVAVVNGEIAELGMRVGGFGEYNYNWGATVLWVANKNKLISGKDVKPGDKIVSLKETGFRSNGLSLVRKIFKNNFGDNWHETKHNGKSIAELALTPSKIYSSTLSDMTGGYNGEKIANVKAAAHITGGGIPGKLGRVLKPSGCGAEIDDPFEPSDIMKYCQKLGNIPDKEVYRTWNMGNGMMIVTDEPEKVMMVAKQHNIDSKIAGTVTKEPTIKIKNKGIFKDEEFLTF